MAWLNKFRNLQKVSAHDILKKKNVIFITVATVVSGGYLLQTKVALLYPIASNFQKQLNIVPEKPTYISVPHNLNTHQLDEFSESDYSFWILPKKQKKYLPLALLDLAQYQKGEVRQNAVRKLSEISNLDDSQYRLIAQASDMKTAIGVARNFAVTHKLFLPPPSYLLDKNHQETIKRGFLQLFENLPLCTSSQCVNYLTMQAQRHLRSNSESIDQQMSDAMTGTDENMFGYGIRKQSFTSVHTKKFLEALLAHSTVSDHRNLIVKNGVLALLYRTFQEHSNNIELKSLIGQIIGNIALEKGQHNALFISGWVGVLAMWLKSSSVAVNFPAARALANMDVDQHNIRFEDGLYLLYPQCRHEDLEINADVVFIHGVMGGAFRTWRQQDHMKPVGFDNNPDNRPKVDPRNVTTEYTYCWPKDWLSVNFPHLRIIAVDYDSHVSEWKTKCPVDKEKRDLKSRAKDTLNKLVEAGIGRRPVIWVSHSMGGILLKQLLLDSLNSQDPAVKSVAEKTLGTVFFCVPHKGTKFANVSRSAMLFLQPSVETQELKQGSSDLLHMNEEFLKFVEKYKVSVLSFGETRESHIGMKWKSILVSADSANPGVGEFVELPMTHLNTCKPETHESQNYVLLVKFLSRLLPQTQPASKTKPNVEVGVFIASTIIT